MVLPVGMRLTTTLPSERWSELHATLTRAVHRLAPAYLRAELDDMVQDGMVRLVNHDGHANNTYVWRVAWSVVQDHRRRRRRKPEHGEAGLRYVSDDAPGPERHAADHEVRGALAECLEAAPASRRDLLTLYLLGHTPGECAELLDVSRKTSENAIYRGLAALRACLEGKGVR